MRETRTIDTSPIIETGARLVWLRIGHEEGSLCAAGALGFEEPNPPTTKGEGCRNAYLKGWLRGKEGVPL